MSNYDYEDDDFDTPSNDGNDLVKQLRKANKQKEKELADLQDIDPTEESVSKWLEDYADVFGYETQSNQSKPNVDPKQAAAYQRMTNAVEQGATPEFQADIHRKLMNANSREELDEIIRSSGL